MKYDLAFESPYLNAPGSLGFIPPRPALIDLSHFGAFVTNPISLGARSPAHARACLAYPGGYLLHTGHPNPGIHQARRRYAPAWARSSLPIIVALLPQDVSEALELLRFLEALPNLAGVELCLPPDFSAGQINHLARGLRVELPVILRLPFDRVVAILQGCDPQLGETVTAISLGPPRGRLPRGDGSLVHGRLYGPALFPQVLSVLEAICTGEWGERLAIIAGCGVTTIDQAQALISAGAFAVQFDAVLWRGGLTL